MVLIQWRFILRRGKMEKNQEKLYLHVPSLCNECQNLNWDNKYCAEDVEKYLACGCHVLVEMLQEEAKNSKFQPSEKHNSERIDIESTKKSTLPPSKSCVSKMSWLSLLGIVCLCTFLAFIVIPIIYFIGLVIYNTNSTKTSVDDFGSK